MKNLLLLLLTFFITINLQSQSTQKGGFTYGWQNYGTDNLTGLGERAVTFDSTGLADIVHAPAIGVHPRVYFGPSEIPDIISRLANTESGQAVRANIHAYTTLIHLGSSYNQNSSYALDNDGNRHIDNSGAWNTEPFFTALKNNDPTVWDGVPIKTKHRTAAMMSLEAFMCCLLYTSPSPRDATLSRMPSSA